MCCALYRRQHPPDYPPEQIRLVAPDHTWNEIYNVSNGEPITARDWFAQFFRILDRPFRPRNVPESPARMVEGAMEFISYLPFVKREPSMTRFTVAYQARTMTMSIEKARRKLNYSPQVSNQEGFKRLAPWYSAQRGKP